MPFTALRALRQVNSNMNCAEYRALLTDGTDGKRKKA
jgi:hypothetical protein